MPTDLQSPSPPPEGLRGRYQLADCTMTLREGLADYYRVNPGLSDPDHIVDPKSARYFRNHDATHVVFGTHTSVLNESVNDLLTMLGVSIRWRDYLMGFLATAESKEISKDYLATTSVRASLALLGHTVRLLPSVWRHARAMKKKWPWDSSPELDRPLDELRAEYGIEVLHPDRVLGLDVRDAPELAAYVSA